MCITYVSWHGACITCLIHFKRIYHGQLRNAPGISYHFTASNVLSFLFVALSEKQTLDNFQLLNL